MTDKPSDSTGDRINKAVADERRRITAGRPAIKTEIGWGSPGVAPVPTFSLTISGGDPDKLLALGQEVATDVLRRLPEIAAGETSQ